MAKSLYNVKFNENVDTASLCTVELTDKDIKKLQSAIEDLKKDIDAAIEKTKEEHGKAVVFQLDCSCAVNRTSRKRH